MPFERRGAIRIFAAALVFSVPAVRVPGQAGTSESAATLGQTATDQTPTTVLKTTTRLVSVEVIARDRQGRPVPGLTSKDFQVFEQVQPKKDQRPQVISVFQVIDWLQLRAASQASAPLPTGVYSNLVNSQKTQVPPTVLLFDAINTDLEAQMQVHQQMLKMIGSIPPDVPVAVFLMSDRLHLLQSFTTDPKLVHDAAAKTLVVGQIAPDQDPADDPNSLSAALEGTPHLPAGFLASLEGIEKGAFSFAVSVRMRRTLDSLRGIARYLDGYPGRKNLLWISTSFPLLMSPSDQSISGSFTDMRDFQGDMQEVGSALMDSKIAIYPVDAGGVRTQTLFEASVPKLRQPGSGGNLGAAIQREDTLRQGAQQVMRDLADETGGRACLGDNDFADCIKKAVDDSNLYYELGYYPDAGAFHGEYHRIILKTAHPGVHLSYREGYYARPAVSVETNSSAIPQQSDPVLNRAACEDPLPSTAILLMVQAIPPDQAGAAKYFIAVDPHMLTFAPSGTGNRELGISLAACTFDKAGEPLQYLQKNSVATLNEQQYDAASHGVTQTFQFAPKPGIARVRLLVRDSASGRIGSVDVPYAEPSNPAPTIEGPPSPQH